MAVAARFAVLQNDRRLARQLLDEGTEVATSIGDTRALGRLLVPAAMLAVWDEWSRLAPDKYTPGACAAKWRSFGRRGGLTLGSLIHWAREDGWTPPKITHNGLVSHEGNGKERASARRNDRSEATPSKME